MTWLETEIALAAKRVGDTARILARETGQSPRDVGIVANLAEADTYRMLVKRMEAT